MTQDAAVTLSSGVFTDAAEPFVDCAGSSLQQREGGRGRGCFAWDPADVRAFAGVVSYLIGASIVAVPPAELATAVIGSGLRATRGARGETGARPRSSLLALHLARPRRPMVTAAPAAMATSNLMNQANLLW